jgi:Transglutaminase-like enzymes, putative cysteine proteases
MEEKTKYSQDYLFYFLGIISLLGCYTSVFGSVVSEFVLLLFLTISSGLLFGLFSIKNDKTFWSIMAILAIITGYFFINKYEQFFTLNNLLVDARNSIFRNIYVDRATFGDKVFFLGVIFCVLSIIGTTIFKRKGYLLTFTVTITVLVLSMVENGKPSLLFVLLTILFLVMLYFRLVFEKNISDYQGFFKKQYSKTLLILASIFIVVAGSVTPVFRSQLSFAKDLREQIGNQFGSWGNELFFNDYKAKEVDLLTAGNRYFTHETDVVITSSEPIDIYLKDFSSANYEKNSWVSLSNNVYQTLKIDWTKIIYTEGENEIAHELEFIDYRNNLELLTPYFMAETGQKLDVYFDTYIKNTSQSVPYKIDTFTANQITRKEVSEDLIDYNRFVLENYSGVPEEIQTLFDEKQIVDYLDIEKWQDFVNSVKKYLADNAEYTLTPGWMPEGEEFINYFLYKNKKGYCVHYATAAAMIFRYFGFSARYVEGYHLTKSAFNGGTVANLLDSDAHAWVEVYFPEYGWVPVEVTPSSNNSETDQENTLLTTTTPETINEVDAIGFSGNENNSNADISGADIEGDVVETTKISISYERIISFLLGCAVVLWCCAVPFATWYNMKKMQNKERKQAVYQCAYYINFLEKYYIKLEEEIREIIYKAQFSQHPITEEEYLEVFNFVTHKKRKLFKMFNLGEKIIFHIKFLKFTINSYLDNERKENYY